jgi:primosomal replication protein N
VTAQLKALAIGSMVAPLQTLALGEPVVFSGFLATGRNGRGLVFHITAIGG